eukprot:evm.model.scf_167.20 EVM.evm.TU.scf_167.20   scf_167:126901-131500(+)
MDERGAGMDLEAAGSDSDRDSEAANMEAFEREYQADHSWETLAEDEHGRLLPVDHVKEQRARRKRLMESHRTARIHRGMIRYVQLLLDFSQAAAMQDMKPNRFVVMLGIVKAFIREYFDQNPLSQIGIIMLRNGVAEHLSHLSASPESHIMRLSGAVDIDGAASLQNGLELAVDALKSVPSYGHREVIAMVASLNTCDPGDIRKTIKMCKQHSVRVSVVGLAAEVYVCKHVAQETGGSHSVALNERHLERLMLDLVAPPPAIAASAAATLVRMGFPEKNPDGPTGSAFIGPSCTLKTGGYTCNRCRARIAELPSECHICGLTLVSSPHIARAYHHLFPVEPFEEVPGAEVERLADCSSNGWAEAQGERALCFGCRQELQGEGAGLVLRCSRCRNMFCFDCDSFVHESLHNCPGCQSQGVDDVDKGVEALSIG